MSDPFRPAAHQQLMREARIGLTLLAITLGTFVYVAYYRISGSGTKLPEYVVNSPIAESVWPGENSLPLAEKKPAPQTLGSQFDSLMARARDKFGIDEEKSAADKLHDQTGDYDNPTPRKDNSPLPEAKVPVREAANNLALAEARRDDPNRLEKNNFAPPQSRYTTKQSPIDTNDLRPARTIANSTPEIEPGVNKQADRPPQQQVSTMPVIVTPDEAADSDFAAVPLRPFGESTNSQLSSSNDFAPTGDSADQFPSQSLEPDQYDQQQVADDNSFSHEGSRISSQIITSDIAANLTGQPLEPVAGQRQAAKQTSFDGDSLQPRELAVGRESVPGSDGFSTDTRSTSKPINDNKTENLREHLVLAGESFWSIAQEHYHDGRFFRALYEYNQQRVGSFENLLPGSTLATPPKTELTKLWPDLCPGPDDSSQVSTNVGARIYVTRQGDTLFEIARQRLEQASRYLEIQNLNQLRLPDGVNHLSPLPAGIQLVLPMDVSQ